MLDSAGPALDREIARLVLGEERPRTPAYSTDDAAANLLLWRLAQSGVAFKVQELEGRHYCMLWKSAGRALITESAESRPFAICRAALALSAAWPRQAAKRPTAAGAALEVRV